ncbi:ABC transporter permease [Propionicicella superfundia]|uniref:ABC transporter permease n=1 Tax=Propionicicella superfundia TaxID=348582 RepID=UPI00048E5265|nr:ABC transporter permease [Propionicicella superfundia]
MSLVYLGVELKRMGTRAVTLLFCGAMPVVFYFLFGSMQGMDQMSGRGNGNAVLLCFMAFYGACMTAATEAMTIAHERPLGWNRTLRLTPLRPWSYIVVKSGSAVIGALGSVAVLYVVAAIWHQAVMPGWIWLAAVGIALLGALTFAAIGQILCLLLNPDRSTGLLVPVILFCSFLSGVFTLPLSGDFFAVLQQIVPMGGMVNLVLALFGPDAKINDLGGMAVGDWRIWANLTGWIVVGFAVAAWAWRRDTKRQ